MYTDFKIQNGAYLTVAEKRERRMKEENRYNKVPHRFIPSATRVQGNLWFTFSKGKCIHCGCDISFHLALCVKSKPRSSRNRNRRRNAYNEIDVCEIAFGQL